MYCLDCHSFFETAQKQEVCHTEVDTRQWETYFVCPNCGSDDIEDSKKCPVCGEDIIEDTDYCADCEHVAEYALNEAHRLIQENAHCDAEQADELLLNAFERIYD